MAYAVHFAAVIIACYLAAQALTRSTWCGPGWTWRSPRVAILCWQALGLAVGLAAIGLPLAVGLAPYGTGPGRAAGLFAGDLATAVAHLVGGHGWPTGAFPVGQGPLRLALVGAAGAIAVVLLGSTVRSLLAAVRAQRRHRDLLALVGRADPAAPGALVLDHPSAAAYCLPGVRPTVVVSAGALDLLGPGELAAVLSHERAHADERHDLVLLPFTALCRALPRLRWLRAAHDAVALLVEMRADDKARRQHTDAPLAAALRRFAATTDRITPAGVLAVADRDLDARVQRLLGDAPAPRLRPAAASLLAAALLLMPVSLYLAG
ncbi:MULTISPECIES: M56 family metallopeptidase [unclassified Solwaraspora]|uniref:M56 family metallopeptidase n=1 Tax=unclassified Solwaraspora TaxID=2627926 RepID=UPI00259AF9B9|nr:M56 family metallopeptidase [Solwaraspora sp. WMMA2056]WJK40696.1 M48 family metalloprotease [Solwaraspora sp. WMMA2056]